MLTHVHIQSGQWRIQQVNIRLRINGACERNASFLAT
jgi:hypothetical protein